LYSCELGSFCAPVENESHGGEETTGVPIREEKIY
jgi:hypothetical protein